MGLNTSFGLSDSDDGPATFEKGVLPRPEFSPDQDVPRLPGKEASVAHSAPSCQLRSGVLASSPHMFTGLILLTRDAARGWVHLSSRPDRGAVSLVFSEDHPGHCMEKGLGACSQTLPLCVHELRWWRWTQHLLAFPL